MIRIPHLASFNTKGISANIESYCFKYNVRIILETNNSPIVLIHAHDLDINFKQTFYMEESYFTLNAFVVTWIKKKLTHIQRGTSRERRSI